MAKSASNDPKKPVRVTLQIAPDAYRFAQDHAGQGGYRDAADFLNALLNTELLRIMSEPDRPDPLNGGPGSDEDIPF